MVVMAMVAMLTAILVGVSGHLPTHKAVAEEALLNEIRFFEGAHAAIESRKIEAFTLKLHGHFFDGKRPVILQEKI